MSNEAEQTDLKQGLYRGDASDERTDVFWIGPTAKALRLRSGPNVDAARQSHATTPLRRNRLNPKPRS